MANLEEMFASALLKESTEKLQEVINDNVQTIQKQLLTKIESIESKLNERVSEFEEKISETPKFIKIENDSKSKVKIVHSSFDTILKVLQSSKRINKNIMLVGPAGSGKTNLCSDIAESLSLDFYPMSVGLQTTKSDLLGFINAKGDYMTTPIREAFEKGGVLLLDEFDATHAGVVTILNSMLANNICSFPDKIIKRNENFICIVACNTYGKGGDIDYIGRNRLDGATLDRFITINVDYDSTLEKKLVKNDKVFKLVNKIRANIEKHGIKFIVSPRASMQIADLLDVGFTIEETLEMAIFKGCSNDVKTKLIHGVDLGKFNVKKEEKAEKKTKTNRKKPILVSIDIENGTYCCSNVCETTSIISLADWEADYSIFISSQCDFSPKITHNEMYLNLGKDMKCDITKSGIEKLIKTMNTYTVKLSQPIQIDIIKGDEKNSWTLG